MIRISLIVYVRRFTLVSEGHRWRWKFGQKKGIAFLVRARKDYVKFWCTRGYC